MKSLKFFKPTLATTLAIVLAGLLSVRPAQAGYTVTLQQVGLDVVATGSGAIDLTGLTSLSQSGSLDPYVIPHSVLLPTHGIIGISTGPTSSSVDTYSGPAGPTSFGSGGPTAASSGSGDMVGIATIFWGSFLNVPTGYVSDTFLSDMAIYSGTTLAQLGVTPGTYVWTWGTGANQNFTLQILTAILPATNITSISSRASVQTGEGVTIAGFIVSGTDAKTVVLRGLGPTLTGAGVTGVLADPTLQLFDGSGHPMWFNDNWKDTQQAQIQATGLAPPNDLESAILQVLQPGHYSAVLSGKNGTTGVGLVEVYDISPGVSAELTNVSTRGFVGTGNDVMIGGSIVRGGASPVLVRALGPSLAPFGVVDVLTNPTIELRDANGTLVAANDNWKQIQQTDIQSTGLQPANDAEAAIFTILPSGAFTVIVRGANGTSGIALLEIYNLESPLRAAP